MLATAFCTIHCGRRLAQHFEAMGAPNATQAEADIEARLCQLRATPAANLPLASLNKAAVACAKAGDHASAVAHYRMLALRATQQHLTHRDMHVCHSNCAASLLALGLHAQALEHADTALALMRNAAARGVAPPLVRMPAYPKALLRKGRALLGLGRPREAVDAFELGLGADAASADLRAGLQQAQAAMVQDLLDGKQLLRLALPPPVPLDRITLAPHAAPLHKLQRADLQEQLPALLLAPAQAEGHPAVAEAYGYARVQEDIRAPSRYMMRHLTDTTRHQAMRAAVQAAVAAVIGSGRECRVLVLGCGAGLLPLLALRAGAKHVTCVDRHRYLADACGEVLLTNGAGKGSFCVVSKRAAELQLLVDVPVCCNLLVVDGLEDGLLTSGILPDVRHALDHLMVRDGPLVLPASTRVMMQAIQVATPDVCGLDLTALDRHRWFPSPALPAPLDYTSIQRLTAPQEAWHFDLLAPPDRGACKTLDVEFAADGAFNAVMAWCELDLGHGITLSTSGEKGSASSLQPSLHWLPGQMRVKAGEVLPLQAAHNTVGMSFGIEDGEYEHLMVRDPSFPHAHFAMAADAGRLSAYEAAIQQAVARLQKQGKEVHALDMGTGSGALAMMAAQAGATSVTAVELHQPLVAVARRAVAANGLSGRVAVVHGDVAAVERGQQGVPYGGVNLAVFDLLDAGLIGNHVLFLLESAKRKLLQEGAITVPAGATVWAMGLEVLTPAVEGCDMSPLDRYRWAKDSYEAVHLNTVPHTRLTDPTRVFDFDFGSAAGTLPPHEAVLKMAAVAPGTLNAVAFWFDLQLAEGIAITTAPAGIAVGGQLVSAQPAHVSGADVAMNISHTLSSLPSQQSQQAHQPQQPAQQPAQQHAQQEQQQQQASGHSPAQAVTCRAIIVHPNFISSSSSSSSSGSNRRGNITAASTITQHTALPKPPSYSWDTDSTSTGQVASFDDLSADVYDKNVASGWQPGVQEQHYWGQALQYLDSWADVQQGDAVRLLARREGTRICFSLCTKEQRVQQQGQEQELKQHVRQEQQEQAQQQEQKQHEQQEQPGQQQGQQQQQQHSTGPTAPGPTNPLVDLTPEPQVTQKPSTSYTTTLSPAMARPAPRAPWLRLGAGIEDAHVWAVRRCENLIGDWLQRVPSGRFPSMWRDMSLLLSHCGSLQLCQATLGALAHEFGVLEALAQQQANKVLSSPGATPEAVSRPPLRWY